MDSFAVIGRTLYRIGVGGRIVPAAALLVPRLVARVGAERA